MASEKVKFKKQRRNRSFVSLENLDASEVTVEAETEEQKAQAEVAQMASPLLKELHPTYILQKAYNRTKEIGSTTAMIGIQNGNKLHLCNLGDSGFQIYRRS